MAWILKAAENGADAGSLRAIQNATSIDSALDSAATYLETKDTQLVNLGDGRSQLIDAATGKVIASYRCCYCPYRIIDDFELDPASL